jgi:hypothetical protein
MDSNNVQQLMLQLVQAVGSISTPAPTTHPALAAPPAPSVAPAAPVRAQQSVADECRRLFGRSRSRSRQHTEHGER